MHTFETARLLMRPLQPEDEIFYCTCYTDPVLMQHIGEPLAHDVALRSFKAALKPNSESRIRQRTWVMEDIHLRSIIGLLGLVYDEVKPEPVNAQIGAIILDEFQNRGFAAEAIAALVDIAFSRSNLAMLYTQHTMHHGAARSLMEKLGFQHETKVSEEVFRNQWLLQRADWRKRIQDPIVPR